MKTTFGFAPKVVALSFVKISVKEIQQHSPRPVVFDNFVDIEEGFLLIVAAFINNDFMMSPRYKKNIFIIIRICDNLGQILFFKICPQVVDNFHFQHKRQLRFILCIVFKLSVKIIFIHFVTFFV